MNIKSLIGKFTSSSQAATQLTVVVQPSALFFSSHADSDLPNYISYEHGAWQEALSQALKSAHVSGVALNVVLSSDLYQTYQIEKPNIPEEELSGALPFLLKDLISEKVTDIIADSIALSSNGKLQVYVVNRGLIVKLYETMKSHNIELNRVMVEDEVWGHSAGELSHFLLLQRSKQGPYKVSAYVDTQCAFQRTIRGVTPPLTGVASSVLQLDSLALELQRSIDYLSSQLRGASLHKMQLCCDEEEQDEVVQALAERLSVKVDLLSESNEESGAVLVSVAQQLNQSEVNLFPDTLKPKKERFTLTNVVASWLVVLIVFGSAYGYLSYRQQQLAQDLARIKQQESQFSSQLTELNTQLANHKPTAKKIEAVERLKLQIVDKKKALKAMDEHDESQQVGYSGAMRSLAELGRNDISLSAISIDANRLDMRGLAREAKAIPNWVNQFKSELNLVGRSFEKLVIGRNEQDIITFELKTKRESE
jgi:MSHA biogenesis protein MshI